MHVVLRANQCSCLQFVHEKPTSDGRDEDGSISDHILWSYARDKESSAGDPRLAGCKEADRLSIASTRESVEFAR